MTDAASDLYAEEISNARRYGMRPFALCSDCGRRRLLHLADLLCDDCHPVSRSYCPTVSVRAGSGDGCISPACKRHS